MTSRKLVVLAVLVTVVAPALADDWPQWRGPTRDGQWRETGLLETLPPGQIKVLWRAEVGPGYSGPTVAAGRVYVTDKHEAGQIRERVHCFEAATGRRIWLHTYPCRYRVSYPLGPRASVTVNDGRAYALGTMGHFHCLDAATGKVLWKKDLAAAYRTRRILWGMAASPLVYGETVILNIGGAGKACIVALDRKTGREMWTAFDDAASYSAPVIITQAGRDVLVCWTKNWLVGLDTTTGKVHWQVRFDLAPRWSMNITTPIVERGRIFVSSCFDGAMVVRLGETDLTARKLWQRCGVAYAKTDALHCVNSTPILLDGHVYGFDSRGQMRCLKVDSGDRVWEDLTVTPKNAKWGTAHMVQNGRRVWMFNEQGEVIIATLSPVGLKQISRSKLLEPTHKISGRKVLWAHPAFADRCIYARSDRELVCGDLSAK